MRNLAGIRQSEMHTRRERMSKMPLLNGPDGPLEPDDPPEPCEHCNEGKMEDGSVCEECGGTGLKPEPYFDPEWERER